MNVSDVLLSLVLCTMTAPCSGMPWTKTRNLWCRRGAIFSDLVQAKTACLALGSSCHGVRAEHCDGRTGISYLCQARPISTSHSASCVYTPRRVLSTPHGPTTGTELRSAVREYLTHSPTANCADTTTTATTTSTETIRLESFLSTPPPGKVRQALPKNVNLLENIRDFPNEAAFPAVLFTRKDESSDADFYKTPRFVHHIDNYAIGNLKRYYAEVLSKLNKAHLDICSSWDSFLPEDYKPEKCVGLGMNMEELKANTQLTRAVVHDLNKDATLDFPTDSFDAVTCVVSIDYLTDPIAIMKETNRVLKPGGVAVVSFSNRAFWTKVTRIWMETSEWQRLLLVAAYMRAGGLVDVQAMRVSRVATTGMVADPLYVVQGRKQP